MSGRKVPPAGGLQDVTQYRKHIAALLRELPRPGELRGRLTRAVRIVADGRAFFAVEADAQKLFLSAVEVSLADETGLRFEVVSGAEFRSYLVLEVGGRPVLVDFEEATRPAITGTEAQVQALFISNIQPLRSRLHLV